MAVTFVATGGVTLAGGVLPRVVDFLDEATFREAFEAKAPVDASPGAFRPGSSRGKRPC